MVWDAVNEAVANTDVEKYAGRDVLADAFIWAHEANPNVPLAYNENTIFNITQNDAVGNTDAKIDSLLHYLIDEKHAPVECFGLAVAHGRQCAAGSRQPFGQKSGTLAHLQIAH